MCYCSLIFASTIVNPHTHCWSLGHLGAAVVELRGSLIKGVIRLVQLTKDLCLIDGTVDGLSPGKHALNIHTYGDISDGCER